MKLTVSDLNGEYERVMEMDDFSEAAEEFVNQLNEADPELAKDLPIKVVVCWGKVERKVFKVRGEYLFVPIACECEE